MIQLRAVLVCAAVVCGVVIGYSPAQAGTAAAPASGPAPTVAYPVHMDLSAPLIQTDGEKEDKDKSVRGKDRAPKKFRDSNQSGNGSGNSPTPGTGAPSTLAAPALGASFEGVGQGFTGPAGTFSVNAAPPDPNGAVGPNHYVETVNSSFAIFNKSGTPLYGPVAINTLWSGFGGGCQTNNDGDPMVLYDQISDRFIISQFSVTTTPYLQCVAVSQTGDPTGAYFRYSYSYGNVDFPDYPKFGVWPDGYYVTFNIFTNGSSFGGAKMCSYDRARMITGTAAAQICFPNTSTLYGGLLPSSVDGRTPPPAGAPNYIVALGAASPDLAYWRFHSDFVTPSNSTLSGPTILAVQPYSYACNGGTCIPQAGTTQRLDSLADRLMYRLAYRNFGDHEAMVVNHAVTAGSGVGVRWYELRVGGGNALSVYQQGTYAPDANYRWMASAAFDQAGNIGLGFSLSGTALKPSIHYTGRLASDPLGTMPQGEGTIIDGNGVQTGSALSRWGDYTSLWVDPTDDCTFWYTGEYLAANGAFNWHTRVGTFKFAGCGAPPPNDFSISATPNALSVQQGNSGTSTISTTGVSGTAETITLSAAGLPSGASASFNPTSVTTGASSTLTVTTASTTPTGTYPVTVTGTAPSATHSTTVTLTVTAPPPANDFSIGANPSALSIQQGNAGTSTITTAVTAGAAETVTFSASGLPSGATASFNPTSVNAGGSSTLTITTAASTPTGSFTVTVTGTSPSTTHTTTIALTVTAPPPPNDFSISASPASLSIQQGNSGTSTISTTVVSGTAETITLGASGLPSGASASFNPASVTTGGSSTLTIATAASTPTGSYSVTVTGTSPAATHSTAIALSVTAPPPPSPIVNGGFETGSLSGWTTTGATGVSTTAHSGRYSARVGSPSPISGNSTISQTFTVSSGLTRLSFWYRVVCTDTVRYDWATATLRDNTTGTTTTMLPRTCSNNGSWSQRSANVTAGHSYTLTLLAHDDNWPGDPTYALYDDVTLQ